MLISKLGELENNITSGLFLKAYSLGWDKSTADISVKFGGRGVVAKKVGVM